jgi:cobalt-zinc-cadmium efflux system outer membrane protein
LDYRRKGIRKAREAPHPADGEGWANRLIPGRTPLPQRRRGWRRVLSWACLSLLLVLPPLAAAQTPTRITLEEAIRLALVYSPTIKAARTQIQQNQAQEITANLRPNPTLSWDAQFIPIFQPSQINADTINDTGQFDFGVGYLIERGKKRQHRLEAAQDATSVTRAQVADAERNLSFNVAQQFISVLLAESTLQFAQEALKSYQDTVGISEQRYRAGDMSGADLLKIKLQLLQFQTDVSSARLACVQALQSLRELIGFAAVPADYDVAGELAYTPLKLQLDELKAAALDHRPDLLAARRGVTAAQSQFTLAQANGKHDLGTTFNYSHVSGLNTGAIFFNIPLPVFDRNQGEIARTKFAIGQAELTSTAASETVLTDVSNGYEGVRSADEVVELYLSGYLDQAKESRDISAYSYQRGAASLLDFLDAERTYRSTQLAYRQALANYLLAVEQLKQAVGVRNLP